MQIEKMTSKQISDELSNHGIKMHFNTKRDKLVNAFYKRLTFQPFIFIYKKQVI